MGSPAGRPKRSNNNDMCATPICYRLSFKNIKTVIQLLLKTGFISHLSNNTKQILLHPYVDELVFGSFLM